jgi:hypothetical protein
MAKFGNGTWKTPEEVEQDLFIINRSNRESGYTGAKQVHRLFKAWTPWTPRRRPMFEMTIEFLAKKIRASSYVYHARGKSDFHIEIDFYFAMERTR